MDGHNERGLESYRVHKGNNPSTVILLEELTPETLGQRSDDDVLLYPAYDGCVIDNPRAAFRRLAAQDWRNMNLHSQSLLLPQALESLLAAPFPVSA